MKRALALLLVALLVLAAASCGVASNSSENSSDISSEFPSSSAPSSSENSSQVPPSSSQNSSEDVSQDPSSQESSAPSSDVSDESSSDSSVPSKDPSSELSSNLSSLIPSLDPDSSSGSSSSGFESPFTPISNAQKWSYNNITDTQKFIYAKLYEAIITFSDEFIEFEDCDYNDLVIADYALRRDFPEIFWMSGNFYTTFDQQNNKYSMGYSDGKGNSGYICSLDESKLLLAALEKEIFAFIDTLDTDMTEYEIALAAHDYIASKVSYDYEAAEDQDSNPYSFTAYGALVSGKAVCEGYAKAFQLLMNSVGINAICVTGTYDGVGHMWNMVNIGGDWYHVDVTSDDQTTLYHRYFNQTDKYLTDNKYTIDPEFSESVVDGEGFNISRPKAETQLMNYYFVSGYVINSPMPIDDGFYTAVETAINGEKSSIEIMLDPVVDLDTFNFDEYISDTDLSTLGITSVKVTKFIGVQRLLILGWEINK